MHVHVETFRLGKARERKDAFSIISCEGCFRLLCRGVS